MDVYIQKIDGIPLTFQLTEEEAIKRGLTAADVQGFGPSAADLAVELAAAEVAEAMAVEAARLEAEADADAAAAAEAAAATEAAAADADAKLQPAPANKARTAKDKADGGAR